ncbi:MAG TPA: TonB family protein [Vicinamibacterales bacterium]|jgi:protein TonB
MPQEFLRDVLRTGDSAARARRRLSIVPISIAAHVLAVTGVMISPLFAEVELPLVSSPMKPQFMRTVAPPSPPPPRGASEPPPTRPAAPIEASSGITPERTEAPTNPVEGAIPLGVGVSSGEPGLVNIGVTPPPPLPPPPPQPRLVRVGQGVREPKKTVHVAPEYPELARRAGIEGVVILEAVIDVSGRVDQVKVLTSVPMLNDAAIRAVKQWRYTPTELNGVPVPVLMTITVRFSIVR